MVDFDIFAEFHAVVLEHPGRGQLRWSPTHEGWLRHSGSEWEDAPMHGDAVYGDQAEEALEVAEEFLSMDSCDRCGGEARPDLHYIAVNVFESPEVFCVGWPAFDVVDSAGGTGQLKHWGSPFACHAPGGAALITASVPWGRESVVSAFVYGYPLLPEVAMARPWCQRCRAFAWKQLNMDLDGDGDDPITVSDAPTLVRVARLIEDAAN